MVPQETMELMMMGIPIAPHIVAQKAMNLAHSRMELEETVIVVLPIMEVMVEEDIHHKLWQVHLVLQMEKMTVMIKVMDPLPTLITETVTIGEFLIINIIVEEYRQLEDTQFQQQYTLGLIPLESWKR